MTSNRTFQVWEYQVGHGQLLIRSPKSPATLASPEMLTNVDLKFLGVEYMGVPNIFFGLTLAEATPAEKRELESLLGELIAPSNIWILISSEKRFPIVASYFSIAENDWDIFESPFKFRSQFREGAADGNS